MAYRKIVHILTTFVFLFFALGAFRSVLAQSPTVPEVPPPRTSSSISSTSNEVITRVGNPIIATPSGTRVSLDRPQPPIIAGDPRQAIIDTFGITMNGFGQQHLLWAWYKFWDVSNTQFITLVRGTTITLIAGLSEQLGCKSVLFKPPATQEAFNVVLIHELGHIAYWCNPDAQSGKTQHENVFAQEGGMTGYAQYACFGTPPVNEDYAEMLTYYVNPGIKEVIDCHIRDQVPFGDDRYPLHFNLANSILGAY